jgi:Phosphotransferase enzyme family/Domain of unknown function (DUF4111)
VLSAGDRQLARWESLTADTAYAALMVLTACRIWRFSAEGRHCSKRAAGSWALTPDPSLAAVRDALASERGAAFGSNRLRRADAPPHAPSRACSRDSRLYGWLPGSTRLGAHGDSCGGRPGLGQIPAYRSYYDPASATAPGWSRRSRLRQLAIELIRAQPSEGRGCFIHRDYHPENTLWSRGRLTGVIDWTSASWGPAAVDTAHMCWNLALTYGLDAADEFLRQYRSLTGDLLDDEPYWDIITVLDLACDLDPDDWSDFDLRRLERYLEAVLELGA